MSNSGAIGILYFNKLNLTKSCIQSVIRHHGEPTEIFAFDNGSQINIFENIQNKFPYINHRRINENKGFSGGFNRCLQWIFDQGHSNALFLTNDTILMNSSLHRCRESGLKFSAGIAAPQIIKQRQQNKIDSSAGFFNDNTVTLHHYHQTNLSRHLDPSCDYVPGTALWITRDAFFRLKGVDESFHTYWEDADLSFRAHQLKIPLIRVPDALIAHGIGQTCHKKPLYTTYLFQRNRIRFVMRHVERQQKQIALKIINTDILKFEKRFLDRNDERRLCLLRKVKEELWEAIAETSQ